MVGFLNAHGTSLGLNGQFISLSMSDDEIDAGMHENPSLIVFPDVDREPVLREPFDPYLEETFWLSMSGMLDNENEQRDEEIAAWVQARYATEIALNDKIGFTPICEASREATEEGDDSSETSHELHPIELLQPRPTSKLYRGTNYKRGKEKRVSGGWKRYAGMRYRSA